jgi:16S rRNA (guanine966-N2)-methyltransferase
VRIIAGSHRGRRYSGPAGLATRPTSDFVRENAFNLIGPLEGARVCDLYAGSGGLGLEALSRGAAACLFVDSSAAACAVIAANLERLGFEARIVRRDAVAALRAEPGCFELVLCDPPYDLDPSAALAPQLVRVLAPGGLVVYQTQARLEPRLEGLSIRTTRRYGSARLTLFEP